MEKILYFVNKNKKIIIAGAAALVVVIVAICLIVSGVKNKTTQVTCTKDIDYVAGIHLDETAVISLKKGKISRIKVDKTITLDKYYLTSDTFLNIIDEKMSGAYQYLDDKAYSVKKNKDSIVVKVDTKNNGVILNNLFIEKVTPTSRDDLSIGSSNVLDSSSSAYKIDDEYEAKDLINKIEGLGYSCKK